MTPDHAGVQLFPVTAVCFRILQLRMFRMLGVIECTALYGRHRIMPDIQHAYVCAGCIRYRVYTDVPALFMTNLSGNGLCYAGSSGSSNTPCSLRSDSSSSIASSHRFR